MTSGLHSCKPGNEPVVGQVKTFTIEQRTAASGKSWTKITSKASDQGGQPYKILSAKPTGHTDSYGNVSFNIEIEPSNGVQPQPSQQAMGPGMPLPPRQHNSDDRSSRIERQHSQEQAIRYATLKGLTTITTDELRALIDWFQRDVGNVPKASPRHESEIQTSKPDDDPDYDEEQPF